ncbi:hypothetical protein C1N73_26950 (plasmid) [Priestia aryabhattai]
MHLPLEKTTLILVAVFFVSFIGFMVYNTTKRVKKTRKISVNRKISGPRVQKSFQTGSAVHYYNVAKNEPREIKPITEDNRYRLPSNLNFSELKRKNNK